MTATEPPPTDGALSARVADLHRQARYTRWFRRHLVVALFVFFVGAYAGYAIIGAVSLEGFEQFAPDESVLPEFAFAPIALNNLRALALIVAGAITFGILSLLGLFVNGLVFGIVVGFGVQESSWIAVLSLVVPHGVVELTAFFMAASIGLRVPHRLVRYLLGWDERPLTRVELFELAVLTVLLVVMIVVAAWIEVHVTPEIAERIVGPGAVPE